jgi:hypothetical protein
MILIYVIYPFPLWSGSKIYSTKFKLKGHNGAMMVKIPTYYDNAADYFRKKKLDYTLMSFPILRYGYSSFNWKYGYYGASFMYILFRHSIFYNTYLDMLPQYSIYASSQNNNFVSFSKMSGIFSIRYIIVNKDEYVPKYNSVYFNRKFFLKPVPLSQFLSVLKNSKDFRFEKRYGLLSLYKSSGKYYLNRIWISRNIMVIKKYGTNTFGNYYKYSGFIPFILSSPRYNIRTSIIFYNKNKTKKVQRFLEKKIIRKVYYDFDNKVIDARTIKFNKPPKIYFKEINPVKYIIAIDKVKKNFFINLNEKFSHYWRIYPVPYFGMQTEINRNVIRKYISKDYNGTIQDENLPSGHILQTLLLKPVSEKDHYFTNGYANGWWISLTGIKNLGERYYKKTKMEP